MRWLPLLMLLACAPHECEMDADCSVPDGGWCEVPALNCAGPFIPACREYHCYDLCSCSVKKP